MDLSEETIKAAVWDALLRKFKVPPPHGDPLYGMDRPAPVQSGLLSQDPWKLKASSNQLNLTLPAPKGGLLNAYIDYDLQPFGLLGGGIRYKQEF